jgi:hypothetical protein
MANPLRKIEIELENLFEKSTGVFSTHTVQAGKILARMIEALEENAQAGPGGRWIAPNRYHLKLGKRSAQTVEAIPDLQSLFAKRLQEHLRDSEMILLGPVAITWEVLSTQRPESVEVSATIDRQGEESTDGFSPTSAEPVALPPQAFLIINGQRHYSLNRPVINIGRQLDNHLVLDDPLVSRRHVQLRARDGQYLLTDLGSKHGIRLNQLPVREAVLQPGDVLRLGNTELIYGDNREESITQPITGLKKEGSRAAEDGGNAL